MSLRPSHPSFATTCWSQVRRAAALGAGDADGAAAALEQLCQEYWFPLYAFLRRSGHPPDQAEDHVQSFFTELLERRSLQHADPQRGRFRSFLLAACRNHVSNRQRAERTLRRGGGIVITSFDAREAERRYAGGPSEDATAESVFLRQWALSVIGAATAHVRSRYEQLGRLERFDALAPLIAPEASAPSQAEVAEQLGISVAAVKVAAHRLRQQLGVALREEIARTLDTEALDTETQNAEAAVEDELNLLIAALGGG